jgi:hypothetical protein
MFDKWILIFLFTFARLINRVLTIVLELFCGDDSAIKI